MNSCSAPPAAVGFVWLLGAGLRAREWASYRPGTDTFPWSSTTVVLRQLFSLTVAGAASGLRKQLRAPTSRFTVPRRATTEPQVSAATLATVERAVNRSVRWVYQPLASRSRRGRRQQARSWKVSL